MMSKKKKKYYPNNWHLFKEQPDEFYIPIDYDEFMVWKMDGWQIPSSVACIIRETNIETGKVKEWVYDRMSNANKRALKIMQEGVSEFVVCTHDDLAHMYPKDYENT